MDKGGRIANDVRTLSLAELAQFHAWFVAYDWAAWDHQIETDAQAGKLDALAEGALRDHAADASTVPRLLECYRSLPVPIQTLADQTYLRPPASGKRYGSKRKNACADRDDARWRWESGDGIRSEPDGAESKVGLFVEKKPRRFCWKPRIREWQDAVLRKLPSLIKHWEHVEAIVIKDWFAGVGDYCPQIGTNSGLGEKGLVTGPKSPEDRG